MKSPEASNIAARTLPALAGGAPEPDQRLLSEAEQMEPRAAASVNRWVQSWQAMGREEFEECARHL